ncbi:MAG: putative peptidoglycan glycosyltransferase FtsW [Actinomycetota bacterium]
MTSLRSNMFFVALALSLFGLVMVYSATYREYGAHYLLVRAGHVVLGVGAFILVRKVRYTAWRRYASVVFAVAVAGLTLVLVPGMGEEIGGARRWFDLGPVSLQPAEFAKLAAVISLSCAVARLPVGSGLPVRPLLAVGLLFGLVILEPDFGTSVVLLAGVAGVLWASELRTRDLLFAGVVAVAGLVAMMLLAPYRRERFMTFLDPWAVADGSGYQIVQGLVAIKAGGFFGSGAGSGGQGVAVPEVGTDMIFALIGEELGLLGMIAVIGAFGFLTVAGYRIALYAPSVLGRCLAAGLTTMLAVQAIFNIGAAMAILPLTGMTLPFVSYGGSSLLVCFAAVGILYRISEDSERAREVGQRRAPRPDSRGRHGWARHPRAVRGG